MRGSRDRDGLRRRANRVVLHCRLTAARHWCFAVGGARRLKELQAVAVRLFAVEPAHAWEVVIGDDGVARRAQPFRRGIQIRDEQAGMGLAGRAEVLLDAEMQLDAIAAKPAAAAGDERRRLADLRKSENSGVAEAHVVLAGGRVSASSTFVPACSFPRHIAMRCLLGQLLDEWFSILIDEILNHLIGFRAKRTKKIIEGAIEATFIRLHEHQVLMVRISDWHQRRLGSVFVVGDPFRIGQRASALSIEPYRVLAAISSKINSDPSELAKKQFYSFTDVVASRLQQRTDGGRVLRPSWTPSSVAQQALGGISHRPSPSW